MFQHQTIQKGEKIELAIHHILSTLPDFDYAIKLQL